MRGAAKRTPHAATVPAAALAAALLLAGCSGPAGGGPAWTAAPKPTASEAAGEDPGATSTASSPTGAPGSPAPSGGPRPAPTAAAWKTYRAPDKPVSFDLPEEWIVQAVPPAKGTLPGALALEVKKPDGTFMAALRTGLPPSSSAKCAEAAKREYTVLSSVPSGNLAAGTVAGTIPPRVVFRVIKGYRYFGSYGITNVVAGADGKACELRNTVRGPAATGDYSFGDVPVLRAFAPDEKVAPAKAFNTLAEAGEYAAEGEDFANVQRMLMSLEIEN